MPQDGDPRYEESFNSFLAGVLIAKSRINNFDFFNLMNSFQNTYNVTVVNLGSDLTVPIYLDDNEIRLLKNLDDVISFWGKNTTIRNYLYSFTTPRVRTFFGIPDMEVEKNRKANTLIRKLFKKKVIM